jgi:protein-S-isoprenylcysteine O-methyltransferase Ste14
MRTRHSWVALLSIAAIFVLTDSAWEARLPIIAEALFVAGVILAGIGAMGRVWCSAYIAGYKNGTLITSGPYSMTRNPLYFFSFLGSVGVGLTSETLAVPAIIAMAFALYYPFVIRSEEATLSQLHPEQFDQYRREVPAFFPAWSRLSELSDHTVQLKTFRRHIASAIWFVWLPGLIHLVDFLHDHKYLASFCKMY